MLLENTLWSLIAKRWASMTYMIIHYQVISLLLHSSQLKYPWKFCLKIMLVLLFSCQTFSLSLTQGTMRMIKLIISKIILILMKIPLLLENFKRKVETLWKDLTLSTTIRIIICMIINLTSISSNFRLCRIIRCNKTVMDLINTNKRINFKVIINNTRWTKLLDLLSLLNKIATLSKILLSSRLKLFLKTDFKINLTSMNINKTPPPECSTHQFINLLWYKAPPIDSTKASKVLINSNPNQALPLMKNAQAKFS